MDKTTSNLIIKPTNPVIKLKIPKKHKTTMHILHSAALIPVTINWNSNQFTNQRSTPIELINAPIQLPFEETTTGALELIDGTTNESDSFPLPVSTESLDVTSIVIDHDEDEADYGSDVDKMNETENDLLLKTSSSKEVIPGLESTDHGNYHLISEFTGQMSVSNNMNIVTHETTTQKNENIFGTLESIASPTSEQVIGTSSVVSNLEIVTINPFSEAFVATVTTEATANTILLFPTSKTLEEMVEKTTEYLTTNASSPAVSDEFGVISTIDLDNLAESSIATTFAETQTHRTVFLTTSTTENNSSRVATDEFGAVATIDLDKLSESSIDTILTESVTHITPLLFGSTTAQNVIGRTKTSSNGMEIDEDMNISQETLHAESKSLASRASSASTETETPVSLITLNIQSLTPLLTKYIISTSPLPGFGVPLSGTTWETTEADTEIDVLEEAINKTLLKDMKTMTEDHVETSSTKYLTPQTETVINNSEAFVVGPLSTEIATIVSSETIATQTHSEFPSEMATFSKQTQISAELLQPSTEYVTTTFTSEITFIQSPDIIITTQELPRPISTTMFDVATVSKEELPQSSTKAFEITTLNTDITEISQPSAEHHTNLQTVSELTITSEVVPPSSESTQPDVKEEIISETTQSEIMATMRELSSASADTTGAPKSSTNEVQISSESSQPSTLTSATGIEFVSQSETATAAQEHLVSSETSKSSYEEQTANSVEISPLVNVPTLPMEATLENLEVESEITETETAKTTKEQFLLPSIILAQNITLPLEATPETFDLETISQSASEIPQANQNVTTIFSLGSASVSQESLPHKSEELPQVTTVTIKLYETSTEIAQASQEPTWTSSATLELVSQEIPGSLITTPEQSPITTAVTFEGPTISTESIKIASEIPQASQQQTWTSSATSELVSQEIPESMVTTTELFPIATAVTLEGATIPTEPFKIASEISQASQEPMWTSSGTSELVAEQIPGSLVTTAEQSPITAAVTFEEVRISTESFKIASEVQQASQEPTWTSSATSELLSQELLESMVTTAELSPITTAVTFEGATVSTEFPQIVPQTSQASQEIIVTSSIALESISREIQPSEGILTAKELPQLTTSITFGGAAGSQTSLEPVVTSSVMLESMSAEIQLPEGAITLDELPQMTFAGSLEGTAVTVELSEMVTEIPQASRELIVTSSVVLEIQPSESNTTLEQLAQMPTKATLEGIAISAKLPEIASQIPQTSQEPMVTSSVELMSMSQEIQASESAITSEELPQMTLAGSLEGTAVSAELSEMVKEIPQASRELIVTSSVALEIQPSEGNITLEELPQMPTTATLEGIAISAKLPEIASQIPQASQEQIVTASIELVSMSQEIQPSADAITSEELPKMAKATSLEGSTLSSELSQIGSEIPLQNKELMTTFSIVSVSEGLQQMTNAITFETGNISTELPQIASENPQASHELLLTSFTASELVSQELQPKINTTSGGAFSVTFEMPEIASEIVHPEQMLTSIRVLESSQSPEIKVTKEKLPLLISATSSKSAITSFQLTEISSEFLQQSSKGILLPQLISNTIPTEVVTSAIDHLANGTEESVRSIATNIFDIVTLPVEATIEFSKAEIEMLETSLEIENLTSMKPLLLPTLIIKENVTLPSEATFETSELFVMTSELQYENMSKVSQIETPLTSTIGYSVPIGITSTTYEISLPTVYESMSTEITPQSLHYSSELLYSTTGGTLQHSSEPPNAVDLQSTNLYDIINKSSFQPFSAEDTFAITSNVTQNAVDITRPLNTEKSTKSFDGDIASQSHHFKSSKFSSLTESTTKIHKHKEITYSGSTTSRPTIEILEEEFKHFPNHETSTLCEICNATEVIKEANSIKPPKLSQSPSTHVPHKQTEVTETKISTPKPSEDVIDEQLKHFSGHESSTLCETCNATEFVEETSTSKTSKLYHSLSTHVPHKHTEVTQTKISTAKPLEDVMDDQLKHFSGHEESTLCELCNSTEIVESPVLHRSTVAQQLETLNHEQATNYQLPSTKIQLQTDITGNTVVTSGDFLTSKKSTLASVDATGEGKHSSVHEELNNGVTNEKPIVSVNGSLTVIPASGVSAVATDEEKKHSSPHAEMTKLVVESVGVDKTHSFAYKTSTAEIFMRITNGEGSSTHDRVLPKSTAKPTDEDMNTPSTQKVSVLPSATKITGKTANQEVTNEEATHFLTHAGITKTTAIDSSENINYSSMHTGSVQISARVGAVGTTNEESKTFSIHNEVSKASTEPVTEEMNHSDTQEGLTKVTNEEAQYYLTREELSKATVEPTDDDMNYSHTHEGLAEITNEEAHHSLKFEEVIKTATNVNTETTNEKEEHYSTQAISGNINHSSVRGSITTISAGEAATRLNNYGGVSETISNITTNKVENQFLVSLKLTHPSADEITLESTHGRSTKGFVGEVTNEQGTFSVLSAALTENSTNENTMEITRSRAHERSTRGTISGDRLYSLTNEGLAIITTEPNGEEGKHYFPEGTLKTLAAGTTLESTTEVTEHSSTNEQSVSITEEEKLLPPNKESTKPVDYNETKDFSQYKSNEFVDASTFSTSLPQYNASNTKNLEASLHPLLTSHVTFKITTNSILEPSGMSSPPDETYVSKSPKKYTTAAEGTHSHNPAEVSLASGVHNATTFTPIHIDLPVYPKNSTASLISFEKYYSSTITPPTTAPPPDEPASMLIVDDEATDCVLDKNAFRTMKLEDFKFVTEFPPTTISTEQTGTCSLLGKLRASSTTHLTKQDQDLKKTESSEKLNEGTTLPQKEAVSSTSLPQSILNSQTEAENYLTKPSGNLSFQSESSHANDISSTIFYSSQSEMEGGATNGVESSSFHLETTYLNGLSNMIPHSTQEEMKIITSTLVESSNFHSDSSHSNVINSAILNNTQNEMESSTMELSSSLSFRLGTSSNILNNVHSENQELSLSQTVASELQPSSTMESASKPTVSAHLTSNSIKDSQPYITAYPKIQEESTCKLTDFESHNYCVCSIDSLVKDLRIRFSHSSPEVNLYNYTCPILTHIETGIILGNSSIPQVSRRYNNIAGSSIRKREIIDNPNIDKTLNQQLELKGKENEIFATPGMKVRIPCMQNSLMEISEHAVNYTWTFSDNLPLTEGKVQETEGILTIEYISAQDSGNYTCTIASGSDDNSNHKKIEHHLSVVALPTYTISTTILYNSTEKCQNGDADIISLYFPNVLGNFICGSYFPVCKLEVKEAHCVEKSENYIAANLSTSVEPMSVIMPTLNTTVCDVNCEMSMYTRIVLLIIKNLETIEKLPVFFRLAYRQQTLVPTERITKKANSDIGTEAPKLIIACPPGFGYHKKTHICGACEANTFSRGDETFCTTCPAGQYQPMMGSKSCLVCSSPLQDPFCLRVVYSNSHKFRIVIGVTASVLVLIFILLLFCLRSSKSASSSTHAKIGREEYLKTKRHLRRRSKNIDLEKQEDTEPLLTDRPRRKSKNNRKPPEPPPPDFF